jgi:hypothetical protein
MLRDQSIPFNSDTGARVYDGRSEHPQSSCRYSPNTGTQSRPGQGRTRLRERHSYPNPPASSVFSGLGPQITYLKANEHSVLMSSSVFSTQTILSKLFLLLLKYSIAASVQALVVNVGLGPLKTLCSRGCPITDGTTLGARVQALYVKAVGASERYLSAVHRRMDLAFHPRIVSPCF